MGLPSAPQPSALEAVVVTDPPTPHTPPIERKLSSEAPLSRWMGWRLRLLMVAALLGCVALLLLARWLAATPHLDATWRAGPQGQLELASATDPQLKTQEGRTLIGVIGNDEHVAVLDALTLHPSSRWVIDDMARERHRAMHEQLSAALEVGRVRLFFSGGEMVEVKAAPRGVGSLGAMFWVYSGTALALYLVAMVVLLARPSSGTLLYAVMALSQVGNLVFVAIESAPSLAMPAPLAAWGMPLRMSFDLIAAAAIVHAMALYPRRISGATTITTLIWLGVSALIVLLSGNYLPGVWWWVQATIAALCLLALGVLTWSYRIEPHPYALVMRRFGLLATCTWALLSVAMVIANQMPPDQQQIAVAAPMLWALFFTAILLFQPFLSKSQQVMREFLLLAAISAAATALDLLFVAAFSWGQFASVTVALFLALGIYSGTRQWLLDRLLNQNVMSTERMFEKLYRVAREVEAHPERASALLAQLMHELFEPMEAAIIEQHSSRARVADGGATLLLPAPDLSRQEATSGHTIAIRFAHHGRHLFTTEDARLAERIVEQLRRAVAFDKAVEQGRSEERQRLAQDLHDDIGARLLTLMYKAQSPEIEDYVRHTLQDLKTLTRGLAAPNRPISHAAVEWKADLTQRLTAAHMSLGWNFSIDCDISLTVVQWSGLTRVIRELVSNVIAHSQAQHVEIDFLLERNRLDLTVTDNGVGRNPRAWSHGLGLGGVRKRVKQLGGEVDWHEASPNGIRCRVCIRQLSEKL